jgi:hypothetical protein
LPTFFEQFLLFLLLSDVFQKKKEKHFFSFFCIFSQGKKMIPIIIFSSSECNFVRRQRNCWLIATKFNTKKEIWGCLEQKQYLF